MTQSPQPNRPAPPPVPPPLAQPVMPVMMPPPQRPVDPKAQRLVTLSHWLGWGGIIILLLGAPALAILVDVNSWGSRDAPLFVGLTTAGIGLLMAIAGAIVGQIGRGMQGRVV